MSIPFTTGLNPPRTKLPPGTVDTHHHVYDARYPLAPGVTRVVADATLADHARLRARLGVARNVIVQPSAYGTDNRLTLAATAEGGADSRAVVVVAPDTPEPDLRRMALLGARGARMNLLSPGAALGVEAMAPLGTVLAGLGWHLQIFSSADVIAEQAEVLWALPCPVVFDHLAQLPPDGFAGHPAWEVVSGMLAAGRAFVKLSSPYALAPGRQGPLIKALVEANPRQVVWGTNWPHPNAVGHVPDDAALVDLFATHVPPEHHTAVFAENATRLYGFAA
ncbi:amidohydrolase family protein [Humitalea sp. 24SJ18S-53]|uniref:amidohydrolase family protein n=1 Tax=Humitalea sp. 24SJ18S-53 TaxID=3422307 RepID=UPI003D66E889